MLLYRRSLIVKLFAIIPLALLGRFILRRNQDLIAAAMKNKTTSAPARPIKRGRKAIVSIEKCPGYEPDDVYPALRRALDAIGFRVPERKRILLKPNIIAQNTPRQATTTHPSIIEAVCRVFAEKNCTITIGESSAFYQGGCTRLGFETTGIAAAARKFGAEILPFEATLLKKITSGKVLNPFYITKAVFDCDLLVNLPKLKLHRLARYTGAIKNTYGCVVGGTKQIYHTLFQERSDYQEYWGKALVDVYEAVNPDLTIMDAIIGLDRDGPAANGTPRFTGLLLASQNGAALDVAACGVIGFDPHWVPAVREALDRGLAAVDTTRIIGEPAHVPYVRLPDVKQKTGILKKLDDHVFEQFIVTPIIDESGCDKCKACVEKCAPKAIQLKTNGFPHIELARCIHCYCCEEYCPKNAISLSGGVTNHLIRGLRQVMRL